jgi:hypothetical protein
VLRPLVSPTGAIAAPARSAGQEGLAPSPAPSVLTALQSAQRDAPDGYSPSEDGGLEQPGVLPSIRANPHRQAGDTIDTAAGRRPTTTDEARP